MYIEASRRNKGDNAKLEIKPNSSPGKTCMAFFYSMQGRHGYMGTLRVLINGENVFEKSGNQGNAWQKAEVTYGERAVSVRIPQGNQAGYASFVIG